MMSQLADVNIQPSDGMFTFYDVLHIACYHTMQFFAKHGLAIACHMSVRL